MTRRRSPELYVRACLFYAGLVGLTLVFAPLAMAALLIPYRARYRLVVQWSRLACLWLRVTCRLDHQVEGLENIPNRAAVILSKHESAWETMMLQRYFSPQAWVLKRELKLNVDVVPFARFGVDRR